MIGTPEERLAKRRARASRGTPEERLAKRKAAAVRAFHRSIRGREFAGVTDYTLQRFRVLRRMRGKSADHMLAALISLAERSGI